MHQNSHMGTGHFNTNLRNRNDRGHGLIEPLNRKPTSLAFQLKGMKTMNPF